MIRQGGVYWAELGGAEGSAPAFRLPVVVVQNDVFNASRIRTVVVCAITGNLRLARAPGNVGLERGDANLPERSVVNVSQLVTLDRARIEGWIGDLPRSRLHEVVAGIQYLVEPHALPR